MNPDEYANLERMERRHWYYAGKRMIVRDWLGRVRPPRPEDVLLDCGAGTGFFAKEMEAQCRVLVLDNHEESLERLRTRFRPEQVIAVDGDRVPLPPASLDFVTALDVLEHVPDDGAVVRGFAELLRPGGVAVVTVPAGMELWSDWDVVLHHYRRYRRAQLGALFGASEWEIVHLNYTNVFAYPAVWLVRKSRLQRRRDSATRSEQKLPPSLINWLLRLQFTRPARWRMPFPFGVSLLLVARRR
ncbi:MAG TPA: class I SAM-dependent methyltransferase [Opitutus sp.]|nr:class I SAM-dependent methyltransferase [Opitutus sp.]